MSVLAGPQHRSGNAIMAGPDSATLKLLASEVASDRLKLTVTSYPLTEFGKAFADFGGGTLGKIGIRI